jgi:hypothetical protein
MAVKVYKDRVSGTLAQRLRRIQNAEKIAATRARFLGQQSARRQREEQQQYQDQQTANDHMMDNPYEPDYGDNLGSNEHPSADLLDDDWITLDETNDNDLDRAIEADKERWRQEAQQFNWTSIMEQLHAVYMDLKDRTNNWAGQNAYSTFLNCRCLPHTMNSRLVDMVDLNRELTQSLNASEDI